MEEFVLGVRLLLFLQKSDLAWPTNKPVNTPPPPGCTTSDRRDLKSWISWQRHFYREYANSAGLFQQPWFLPAEGYSRLCNSTLGDALLFIPVLGNTGRSDEESEWVEKTDRAGLKTWENALELKPISLTSSRSELRNQGSGNYINSLKEGNGLGTTESSRNKSHWMLLYSLAWHFGLLNLITPLWKNLSARPWQNVLSLPSARHMEICNLLFVPLTLLTQGKSFVQWICTVIMLYHALARWACVLRDGTSVFHLLFSSLSNHL